MSRIKRGIGKTITKLSDSSGNTKTTPTVKHPSWLSLLVDQPDICKSIDYRVKMTISCRDCDYIPKVKDAGTIQTLSGRKYQVMHNGLLVESGGYFGDWMAAIIKDLKGHHEPQEEKLFHEVLKRIPDGSTMIELGSYWSYYSLWFNRDIPGARNYCCEPDPENLKLGARNAKINKATNMHFIQAAAGKDDGKSISFKPQEGDREPVTVPIRSIDGIVQEHNLERVNLIHMDVQGVELSAIESAANSIKAGLVRFIFVSTHHYSISEDPLTHERCANLIKELGGHIVAEHAIHESFSGDGLIVASFLKEDRDLEVEISSNRMKDSLFRSYTKDMGLLIEAYEKIHES
jgi:FkbM family methyltransferase